MKPTYAEGNIFTNECDIIIHGCNMLGKFGKGFAKEIADRHPEAKEAYVNAFETTGLVLGSVIWANSRKRLIANCITQPTYGNDGERHISYDALRTALAQINAAATLGVPGTAFEDGFRKVWMPMIGADLGGGDWMIISDIIDQEMTDLIPVVHYLPKDRKRILRHLNPA